MYTYCTSFALYSNVDVSCVCNKHLNKDCWSVCQLQIVVVVSKSILCLLTLCIAHMQFNTYAILIASVCLVGSDLICILLFLVCIFVISHFNQFIIFHRTCMWCWDFCICTPPPPPHHHHHQNLLFVCSCLVSVSHHCSETRFNFNS